MQTAIVPYTANTLIMLIITVLLYFTVLYPYRFMCSLIFISVLMCCFAIRNKEKNTLQSTYKTHAIVIFVYSVSQ